MTIKNKTNISGFMVLETLVAIAIFGIIIAAIVPTINNLLRRTKQSSDYTRAALLLQEGIEVSYNVFISNDWSTSWGTFSDLDTYAPVVDNDHWALISSPQQLLETKYDRKIEFLCRNMNEEISSCSAVNVDYDSRVIQTTLSWQDDNGLPRSLRSSLLLVKTI